MFQGVDQLRGLKFTYLVAEWNVMPSGLLTGMS